MKEIATSLAKVQSEIKNAKMDSENTHFRAEYASLEAHLAEALPLLSKNGLCLVQGCLILPEGNVLRSTLIHISGESIHFDMPLILSKSDMQGLGSAISYARRYSLAALIGMGSEDDDANDASANKKTEAPKPAAQVKNHAPVKNPDISDLNKPYVIPLGKYKGATLDEIPGNQLMNYVEWLKSDAAKNNKPLTGKALELCQIVEARFQEKDLIPF